MSAIIRGIGRIRVGQRAYGINFGIGFLETMKKKVIRNLILGVCLQRIVGFKLGIELFWVVLRRSGVDIGPMLTAPGWELDVSYNF